MSRMGGLKSSSMIGPFISDAPHATNQIALSLSQWLPLSALSAIWGPLGPFQIEQMPHDCHLSIPPSVYLLRNYSLMTHTHHVV